MFYFFSISGFALWADGLSQETNTVTHIINIIFAIGLLTVSILYPIGYKYNDPSLKIPIYIVLILAFTVLTYRGYKLLQDWKMIFVPVFSVGVNLSFISILENYTDPNNPHFVYNALFHILHDLAGTLAGLAIFMWLVYQKGIIQVQQTASDEIQLNR
ncbi:MAG: hypothetical protein QNJ51_26345 [Calothrix sp. MO_167.B12]|nr:hypothetical protein [Calothrix sp. MO_167.B12]